ncbi:MAG TPA: rhomboid family intramembrane serine protease [Vitreimonas sp.]|nr:rhomboid family intramembrane serine protease [Vitreimonas sp.]
MTLALIGACFVAFAWQLGLLTTGGQPALDSFLRDHGVVPAEVTRVANSGQLVSEPVLDLVTSQFLHVGWLHLLANMLYLWIFGNNIEDRIGRPGFLVFYLVGGVVAAGAQVLIDPGSSIPIVGASGAIAATLGAYLVLFPRARILSLVFLGFFYQLIQVPALLVLGFWFVLQLIDGVASLGATAEGGVAFFAHIGGFVAGLVVGMAVRISSGRWPREASVG